MRVRYLPALGLAATTALAPGCSNAGEDRGFGPGGSQTVLATVYYDRDASGAPSPADTAVAGLAVALLVAGTQDTAQLGNTDATGTVTFTGVRVGRYTLAVPVSALGDSVALTSVIPASVTVQASGAVLPLLGALARPLSTVAQARQLADGARIRLHLTVLSGVQRFADTTVHGRDSTGAIRLLEAKNVSGAPFNIEGDSIQVTGILGTRNGQKVVDSARMVTDFASTGPPTLDTLTTLQAAGAVGGVADAELVFINNAVILNSVVLGQFLVVQVDDGTGVLSLLLDPAIPWSAAQFQPGLSVRSNGVLVPTGTGGWQLKPRGAGDYVIF